MRHMLVLTALRLAVVLFLCGDSVVACCAQDDATLRLSMRFLLKCVCSGAKTLKRCGQSAEVSHVAHAGFYNCGFLFR